MPPPVLVAGAGPVGLTLARELDRLGVAHRIVDSPCPSAVSLPQRDLDAPLAAGLVDAEVEGWPYAPGEIPVFLDAAAPGPCRCPVEASHELAVAYPESPIVAGDRPPDRAAGHLGRLGLRAG